MITGPCQAFFVVVHPRLPPGVGSYRNPTGGAQGGGCFVCIRVKPAYFPETFETEWYSSPEPGCSRLLGSAVTINMNCLYADADGNLPFEADLYIAVCAFFFHYALGFGHCGLLAQAVGNIFIKRKNFSTKSPAKEQKCTPARWSEVCVTYAYWPWRSFN